MARKDGVLYVEIAPSTRGIQRAVEKDLKGAFTQGEKSGSKMLTGLGSLAKGLLTTVGAVGATVAGIALKGGLDRALNIENARAKLKGLGHDTQVVEGIMGNALASVEGTAFGLGDAATVAASAVAAGIKPGQQLESMLKTVANTAAAAGVGMNEMGSIFNKVATANRAYTMEITQLADRGIPIWQKLAERLGVTQEEVRKLASEGKIDFQTFSDAAADAGANVALAMGETTQGTLANLRAALARTGELFLGGTLPQVAPMLEVMRQAVNQFNNDLKELFGFAVPDWEAEGRLQQFEKLTETVKQRVHEMMQAFKLLATGDFTSDMPWSEDSGLVDFILNIREFVQSIGSLGGVIAGAFAPLLTQIPIIGKFLPAISGPLGMIIGAFVTLMATSEPFRDAVMGVLTELAAAGGTVLKALEPMMGVLNDLLVMVGDVIAELLVGLTPVIGMVADAFVRLIPALMPVVDAIMQLLPPIFALLAPLIELVQLVLPALIDLFFVVAEPVLALVAVIVDSLMPVIENLVKMFEGVIDFIVGVFTGDWDRAWAGIVAIFEGFGLAVLAGIDAVFKWLKGLVDEIPKFFANAGEWLWNAGKEIINGLWEGMKSIWNDVVKWFENAWNDLVAGWNDFWGIQSPSRLMIEMGHNIGEGFQIGIEDSVPEVDAALSHMVSIPQLDGAAGASIVNQFIAAPGRTLEQELNELGVVAFA